MSGTDLGQLITFLTLILGFAIQLYRENRNRKWDLEDRSKVAADRAQIAEKLITQNASISSAIQENTEISTQAFREANHVNAKIASTNAHLVRIGSQIQAGTEHAKEAYREANQTNDKIKELNNRLITQGENGKAQTEQSKEQLDSIQTTGEESNVILKENLTNGKHD